MTKKNVAFGLLASAFIPLAGQAQTDSTNISRNYALDEVVVTGTRNETDIRHLPMTVSIVNRVQIEQTHEASLLPILTEQIPGLFTTSRGVMGFGVSDGAAGGISLRGMSGGSGRLMVLIDGHPQYMGLFGHPISDAYQTMMAERVEVLRGPASVLYGSNAMGGVVNIVTRKMKEDGVKTEVNIGAGSYGTFQSEATNRVKKGKFSSTLTASYNRTDGHRVDLGFEQYGGYAKLGYDFSDNWKLWGDVNITHFNASNPGTVSAPLVDAYQRITRGMTSYALENHYERTSGALSFFYNWGRHKVDDGYIPSQGETPLDYRFHSKDNMMGLSWYQSATLFTGNRLTVGFDWYRFGGEAWNQYISGAQSGQRSDIIDETQDEIAGYIDFRQDIGSWLTFDAGVRADHHSHVGTEWIPQVGLSFHLPKEAEIKLSASKGFRYPLIREMFMWGVANPDLDAERMWNYELSYSQKLLDGRLSYGVNVFYIDAENLIRRGEECRRRGPNRLPLQRGMVCRRQLQLPPHGYAHHCLAGAQALRRRGLCQGPLAPLVGYPIHRRPLYRSGRKAEDRRLRPLERPRLLPPHRLALALGQRRKSAGATLRNQCRIPDAQGDIHGRSELEVLNLILL